MAEDDWLPHALLECRANDDLSYCFIQDITAVASDPRNHWPSTCSLIEQWQFLLRVSDAEGFANYDDVLGYSQYVPVYVAHLALWTDSPEQHTHICIMSLRSHPTP